MSTLYRPATPTDAEAIAAIYNHAVAHTTAIWNETLVDADNRRDWMAARAAAGFPVLVAEQAGRVVGYASYGTWRSIEGFRATVEHSIYVEEAARGQGIARALMGELIRFARAHGVHVMVAAIEAGNQPSIRLHESLGFTAGSVMPEVGQKFGRWLDLLMMELRLDSRSRP